MTTDQPGGSVRVILVTRNHDWAADWCAQQTPPVRRRDVVVLTGRHDAHRLMGLRLEDHRLVIDSWPERAIDYNAVCDALLSRGWSHSGRPTLAPDHVPDGGNIGGGDIWKPQEPTSSSGRRPEDER